MSPRRRQQQRDAHEQKRKFKRRLAFKQHSKRRKPGDAHTIPSFCESRCISESLYFSLKRQGKQPREIEVNGRVIITERAAEDWDREREAETLAKRAKRAASELEAAE